MYRPPENSNRVKAIKSKFENSINESSKALAKPPLRKSKTLQDFSVKTNAGLNGKAKHETHIQPTQPVLSRQLSDPSKRNIKRTPAFRLDKSNALTEDCDKKSARLLLNKSRYLDSKLSKVGDSVPHCEKTKSNGYNGLKSTEKSRNNFSDIRNKFNGEAVTIVNNTHIHDEENNKSCIYVDDQSNIRHDDHKIIIKCSAIEEEIINPISHEPETETKVPEKIFTFLYSEPIPKSQRNKQETPSETAEDVYNSSTLKLSETPKKGTNGHVSDDESHYSTKPFVRNGPAYGSLRTKKSLENLSQEPGLTDTLKYALRKPLPQGPAPKKPPRTFLHSPNKLDSPTEVSPLNLDKDFTKKLNTELQKNRTNSISKKSKGDPKYMLDKLETALRNKKILRRSGDDDSDSEKKLKFLNLRDLPSLPPCSSSQTLPNLPYTPTSSSKFNFNCLTSLGCTASVYEPVQESNSSFFVPRKREEPVYAEPFEYQVEVGEQAKNGHDSKGAIDSIEVVPSAKTVRRSVHYASSPVPNVKTGDSSSHVSEVKNQDQIFAACDSNSPSSASDMDSVVSTPSEENKTLISSIKVKDLIKAIENNKTNKNSHTPVLKTNSTPGALNTRNEPRADDDRIKILESQLKNTLDRSFSATLLNAHSESNVSDINEEDGDAKQETAKFETYVKRVRSKRFNRPRQKKEHLFHCCLLVALNRSTPYVKSKFPPKVQEPYKIADLCFPEVESGPMDSSVEAQCYSLIITNEHGERTFGYCRRVLPEASTTCLPLAYCILSKHRAPGFYRKILEELEYRHGYPDKFREAFIEELYNCKFPMPGETMIIDCAKIIKSAGCDSVQLGKNVPSENNSTNSSGHYDMPNFDCDTNDVIDCSSSGCNGKVRQVSESNDENELDLKSFVVVCNNGEYGTLIRGNKGDKNTINVSRGTSAIINIAHDISVSKLRRSTSTPNLLSDIEELPSELVLIRPQDSRHEENDLKLLGETLKIPVLQQVFSSLLLERKIIFVSCVLSKLSSCIEALQIILYPFSWQHTIIPVLPSSLWEIVDAPTPLVCGVLSAEVVNDYKIENAIVVDLDEGAVLLNVGDEDRILPWCLIQTLKDGLSLAGKVTSNKIGAHNVFFSDAFLRIFIQSCGHYKDFIVNGQFQKSEFIQYGRNKGKRLRQFLKWFTETTMFDNFLEMALQSSNSLDLFDQRIQIYSSESATEILNKMKYWTNYKSFIN